MTFQWLCFFRKRIEKISDNLELISKARIDSAWQNELVLDEQQEERGKEELRDQEAVPQVCKRKCKYKELKKILGLWAKTLTESWQRTSGWMYLCRPTYKILSEYASLSLSLFHIFHFYFFHIFQFHFFFSFSCTLLFIFTCVGQHTKLWKSLLHFHTCILRIFAFLVPKFGNSPILEKLCHASWQFGFLRIKSCIAGIFNLIILTTNLSKRIIITLSCTVSDKFMCA